MIENKPQQESGTDNLVVGEDFSASLLLTSPNIFMSEGENQVQNELENLVKNSNESSNSHNNGGNTTEPVQSYENSEILINLDEERTKEGNNETTSNGSSVKLINFPSIGNFNGQSNPLEEYSSEEEDVLVPEDRKNMNVLPSILSATEEQCIKEFLERVNGERVRVGNSPLSWNAGVKFLMARKFSVPRALELYEQHASVRLQGNLTTLNPNEEPLRSELLSAKFTILPSRDTGGAAIAVFTARLHQPSLIPHEHTLQGVVYQLDAALENPETQRSGLVFIYDMTESKYSHFDYELSIKILTLLKGGYPARLKKVLIVTAPLWFRAPFKILRLFVREKLRDRVFTVSVPQLSGHIPSGSLPKSLGGTLEVNHGEWLGRCTKILSSTDLWGISSIESLKFKEMANSSRGVSKESASGSYGKGEIESISNSFQNVFSKKMRRNGQSTPSPVGNSSGSSGFSDDESLPFEEKHGLSLPEFIEHLKQKGRRGLEDEYAEIVARNPEGSFDTSRQRGNVSRNRYSDVLCFDHTRVPLSSTSIEGDGVANDYINANFVDGYKQRAAFISTQGPLPKTFGDFWRMVWEQRVVTIVMTTRVVERGRTKCGQYWPPDEGGTVTHEGLRIENRGSRTEPDFSLSKLKLINTKTNESRNITHLLFLSWPDYGVPSSAAAMLHFLKTIREEQANEVKNMGKLWDGHPLGPPIVIHCSAGIGRTGTLCTIDICLKRLDEQGVIDVQGTVVRIRSQRAHSIQVQEQYLFCHAAVLEYARLSSLVGEEELRNIPDLLSEGDSDSE